jgi:hypothetical protein
VSKALHTEMPLHPVSTRYSPSTDPVHISAPTPSAAAPYPRPRIAAPRIAGACIAGACIAGACIAGGVRKRDPASSPSRCPNSSSSAPRAVTSRPRKVAATTFAGADPQNLYR